MRSISFFQRARRAAAHDTFALAEDPSWLPGSGHANKGVSAISLCSISVPPAGIRLIAPQAKTGSQMTQKKDGHRGAALPEDPGASQR